MLRRVRIGFVVLAVAPALERLISRQGAFINYTWFVPGQYDHGLWGTTDIPRSISTYRLMTSMLPNSITWVGITPASASA